MGVRMMDQEHYHKTINGKEWEWDHPLTIEKCRNCPQIFHSNQMFNTHCPHCQSHVCDALKLDIVDPRCPLPELSNISLVPMACYVED
jgi:Zn finger protein HypA/HybF involved in hydrogenase expression